MINTNFFIGQPQDFKNLCYVYPPLVGEASNEKFFPIYQEWLTISQEEIEDIYNEKYSDASKAPNPYDYLFQDILVEDESGKRPFEEHLQKAFKFFLHEPVSFLYDQQLILIGDLEEELKRVKDISQLRFLNKENYFEFQNLIRLSCGRKEVEAPNEEEDPRIKKMKAKARYRDKIKAKQTDSLDFPSSLAAICCMGIGITPLNIGEISLCAVSILMEYYQEKEKYGIDIRSILAGADSKKIKPKYWIRKLY